MAHPRVREEMLVDQKSEFVLCLMSEYPTASQHHFGGPILHKTVHCKITTALANGVVHSSDYLSEKEVQIQGPG